MQKARRESGISAAPTARFKLTQAAPGAYRTRRTGAHIRESGERGKTFVRKWYLRPGLAGRREDSRR